MVLDGERPDFCSHAASPHTVGRFPKPRTHYPMSAPPPKHDDFIHSEEFLHELMKRQLKLSITCATAFLLLLFGLPLLNYFVPEFMAQRVGGFTLTWLILGVLFFPYVWIIARLFITRSMALEEQEVHHAAKGNKRQS
jgi:uncharacterized membrane protein (DUF485 family)